MYCNIEFGLWAGMSYGFNYFYYIRLVELIFLFSSVIIVVIIVVTDSEFVFADNWRSDQRGLWHFDSFSQLVVSRSNKFCGFYFDSPSEGCLPHHTTIRSILLSTIYLTASETLWVAPINYWLRYG